VAVPVHWWGRTGKGRDEGGRYGPGRRRAVTIRALVLAAPLLAGSAGAAGHEWYTGLRIPSGPLAGRPCCGGQDCRRTEYCVLPSGRQGIVSRFGCVAIPWSRVLGIVSPDGAPHLCEAPLTTVFVPYWVPLAETGEELR
jgi:hypothetical protein